MTRQLSPTEVKRLNRTWRRLATARLGLLLEAVSQPFNVGSIVRTAAAFGVECVWLCAGTADPAHPAVRKTALGTGRYLAFEHVAGPPAAAVAIALAEARRREWAGTVTDPAKEHGDAGQLP